jgi:hypothetical protein
MHRPIHLPRPASRCGLRPVKPRGWRGGGGALSADGPADTARDFGTTPRSRMARGAPREGRWPRLLGGSGARSSRLRLCPGVADDVRILTEGRASPTGSREGGSLPAHGSSSARGRAECHLSLRPLGAAPRSRAVRVCSSAEIQDSISSNHQIQADGELVGSPGERAGSGFAYSR